MYFNLHCSHEPHFFSHLQEKKTIPMEQERRSRREREKSINRAFNSIETERFT
jgi:hypothetical protein